MQKSKKNTETVYIDSNKLLDETKQQFAQSVVDFEKHLAKIVPNKINMDAFMLISVQGKTLKMHNNVDLLISPQNPRVVKIDKTDLPSASKILQAVGKALTQSGYIVNDKDGSVIATLPQFMGSDRDKMIREIKAEKEKYKVSINNVRQKVLKIIDNMSENEQKSTTKKIDQAKDDVYKKLDQLLTTKEKEMLS